VSFSARTATDGWGAGTRARLLALVDRRPRPVARTRSAGFPFTAAPTPLGVEPPPGPALGDRYDAEWARSPWARWSRIATQETLGRAVIAALCRPDVRGRDRLDELEGPVLFVANHHSHLDTALVLSCLPRPWRHHTVVVAAADYFFDSRPKAALASWAWGAIPMERHKVSRRSATRAAEIIEEGCSLLIFPEGGRSPDGWGQPHKGGAAYLAARCGVPVVPIHLDGTDRVLPKGADRPDPQRVTVSFGEPMWAGELDARRFAPRIEAALERLADEATSDWYQARLRAARGETPSLRGPDDDSWRRDWVRPSRGLSRSGHRRSLRDRSRGSDPW
jgi:1-acyl-sn-glycerol-3-phosphate acyltransferase